MEAMTEPRKTWQETALVVGATLVVALVRWWRHDCHPLWIDEAHRMYLYVGKDLSWISSAFWAYPSELPLYGLLVRAWSCLETSAGWIRLLSALFSVLATPVIFSIADQLGASRRARVFLGGLLVVSAYLTFYAQDVSCYSLLLLLGALSLRDLFVIILKEEKKFSIWARFTLVNGALLYTHYFSFLTMAAYNAVIILFFRRRVSLRCWFLSQAITGMMFLPWLPMLWRLVEAAPIQMLVLPLWFKWPLVSLLGPVPMFLIGKSISPSPLSPSYGLELGVLIAGCAAVAYLGMTGLYRLVRLHGWRTFCTVVVLLTLPVLMAILMTALGYGGYNYTRVKYFSSLAPLAFVVAVAGGGWVAATSGLRPGEAQTQACRFQKERCTPAGLVMNRLAKVAWYFAGVVLMLVNCVGLANYHFNTAYQKDARMRECVREMALREKTAMISVNNDYTMWLVAASLQEMAPDWRPEFYVAGGRTLAPGGGPAFVTKQGQFWDTYWPEGAGVMPAPNEFPDRLWLVARVEWRERTGEVQKHLKAAGAFFDTWRHRGYELGELREFVGVQFCLAVRPLQKDR